MQYLYIGYYVNEEAFDLILKKKINNMSFARQKFEINIMRGLFERLGKKINFLSYVPIDNSIKLSEKSILDNIIIEHIFINKKNIISMLEAREKLKNYLETYKSREQNGLCIIMYAVNPIFLNIILKLKKKYNIKIITICSEIPVLRRYKSNVISKIKKQVLTHYNKKFDGYILFSRQMLDVLKIKNKPFMVLEGIAPEFTEEPQKNRKNVVMYAGGLAKDNNVSLLIECCSLIKELDEVWICGDGEEKGYIEKKVIENKKIKYFGRLKNDEVVELEKKAKILVNLRSPEEKLTKYSFPSKILEYISSGTLVVSSKLEGIPEEYFDYIVPISEFSKENIIKVLESIFYMKESEYIIRCKKAQEFIKKEKNYITQVKKIIDFCGKV